MRQRLANATYWFCLRLAVVLALWGIAVSVWTDRPGAHSWVVIAAWVGLVAAVYMLGWVIRFLVVGSKHPPPPPGWIP
jgi:hypothetical protein